MTQATATTAPKAGRQHGGGLVHANQPRATLRSRHEIPSGGAINRRGEAASIIALASSAAATLAYPTTCVRRAQKLSIPLRSTTRPHAQLVVGYKRPCFSQISRSNLVAGLRAWQTFQMREAASSALGDAIPTVIERAYHRLFPAFIAAKLIDKQRQVGPNFVKQLDPSRTDIVIKVAVETAEVPLKKRKRLAYINISRVHMFQCLTDQTLYLVARRVQASGIANLSPSAGVLLFPLLPSRLSTSHTPRCNNRHNSTDSLRPCGNDLTPHPTKHNSHNRTDRLHPRCSDLIPRPTKHNGRSANQNKQYQQPIQPIDITLHARHSPPPCLDQTLSLITSRLCVHGDAE